MAVELELIEGYRYVLVAFVANILLILWMATRVGDARRRLNVPLPTMYADEKEHKDGKTFNCVQRAHQNTLEYAPSMLLTLLLGGLQYPLVAAVLGSVYALARIQYFRGYVSGTPSKRFEGGGVLIFPCFFGLIFCSLCLTLHQFIPNLV